MEWHSIPKFGSPTFMSKDLKCSNRFKLFKRSKLIKLTISRPRKYLFNLVKVEIRRFDVVQNVQTFKVKITDVFFRA